MVFTKKDIVCMVLGCIVIFECINLIYYVLVARKCAIWGDCEETERAVDLKDYWTIKHSFRTREDIKKLEENHCKIPIMDPFEPSLVRFFPPLRLNCSQQRFFFHTGSNINTSMPLITRTKEFPDHLNCCYEHLRFSTSYDYRRIKFKNDTCTIISSDQTAIPTDSQYIIINCWDKLLVNISGSHTNRIRFEDKMKKKANQSQLIVHTELLFFIPAPKLPSNPYISRSDSKDRLNVIILGYDQISRNNFIRLMGKSFRFLKTTLEAIDLQGFNKVGDATLNNTLAFMTGYDFGQIKPKLKRWKTKKNDDRDDLFFDNCPWIWKNFSANGYITMYADDYDSVFNFRFRGFLKQPTDYYLQPFSYWFQKRNFKQFGRPHCIGNEPSVNLLQRLTQAASSSYRNHPHFLFLWNSQIHETPGYPSVADELTLNTLRNLDEIGALNKSLVVLLSDHGWRTGKIMMQEQARIENKMPFAFLLLPKWLQKRYPYAYENLKENQFRLTTPYDIHATMLDILNKEKELEDMTIQRKIQKGKHLLGKGISLFLPISKERSCKEAGIDETWCACSSYQGILKTSTEAVHLARYALKTINSWLKPFKNCKQYELDTVLNAEVKVAPHQMSVANIDIGFRGSQTFRVSFGVKPVDKYAGAQFEVVIFTEDGYWESTDAKLIRMSTEIFRLNAYGNRASCINVYSLKKICTCF